MFCDYQRRSEESGVWARGRGWDVPEEASEGREERAGQGSSPFLMQPERLYRTLVQVFCGKMSSGKQANKATLPFSPKGILT